MAENLYAIQCFDQVSVKITSIPLLIQINCPEETSSRLVQQFMTINEIGFHIFGILKEKPLQIANKSVPLNITDVERVEELKPNFFSAFEKNGKRLSLYFNWNG